MLNNIAIYGAGGFGKEVVCMIKNINNVKRTWNIIGFFDDNTNLKNSSFFGLNVLGGLKELNKYSEKLFIIFSIGNPSIIKKLVNQIHNPNILFPNLISNDCQMIDEASLKIGYGNLIMPQSLISCNVSIGNFNIMNFGTSIGHDSEIGSYNAFMSYTKISGEVKVGDLNYFGACSLILQQKMIGFNTIIGASSVIMRNTEDDNTYLGNPAVKILKPKIK